ncbi:MAG: hypothetical protein RLZZ301_365 [Bacteroidota bacterium]
MKSKLLFFLFVRFSFCTMAQQAIRPEQVFFLVMQEHPMAKQANLLPIMAEAYVLKAKAGFDPKFSYDYAQKNYNDQVYYRLSDLQVKVPTWYGLSVKTGLESNQGSYLNPERSTPTNGLWYGGLSANLGNGLVIDERRAELAKAKIYESASQQEQRLKLNELMFDAGSAYWNWLLTFHVQVIYQSTFEIATTRYQAVKRSVELGDRPAIDTVEARIQWQQRQALWRQSATDCLNAQQELNRFLWLNGEPVVLAEGEQPISLIEFQASTPKSIDAGPLDSTVSQHPYLQLVDFKLAQLDVDRKWNKEQLKPVVELNYNLLNEPVQYNPFVQFSANDYKVGIHAEMPLLLRKERANLALTELRIEQNRFEAQQQQALLLTKMQNARRDYLNAVEQQLLFREQAMDTKRLLEAEAAMFTQGESSLFMLNNREQAAIQAQVKWLEWQVKTEQNWLKWQFLNARLVD